MVFSMSGLVEVWCSSFLAIAPRTHSLRQQEEEFPNSNSYIEETNVSFAHIAHNAKINIWLTLSMSFCIGRFYYSVRTPDAHQTHNSRWIFWKWLLHNRSSIVMCVFFWGILLFRAPSLVEAGLANNVQHINWQKKRCQDIFYDL